MVWWVAPFGNSRRPDRCLVAQGYAGWLIIEHGVKSAPATQVVDGHNLYRFPPKGRIKTSTPIASGFATDEYYYVTPKGLVKIPDSDAPGKNAGSGPMVWAAKSFLGALPDEGIPDTEYAFVGTKSQYDKADRGPSPKSEEQEVRDKAIEAEDRAYEAHKKAQSRSR